MLETPAKELVPELYQIVELEPPSDNEIMTGNYEDRPTGNVQSFTRGSIDIVVSILVQGEGSYE